MTDQNREHDEQARRERESIERKERERAEREERERRDGTGSTGPKDKES